MARKSVALWTVTVAPIKDGQMPMIMNFVSEIEAYEFARTLKRRSDVGDVHMGPGYKIFKDAEEALESFMIWMR